jgi:hypothetical protein
MMVLVAKMYFLFDWSWVARFDKIWQNWEKYTKLPNGHKIYKMAESYSYVMAIKYTNIFYSKTRQDLPKFGFFGLKIYHLATLDWSDALPMYTWTRFFIEQFKSALLKA